MMFKLLFSAVILGMMITACNAGDEEAGHRKDGFTTELKTKEDSLYHDVMEGHDVGMAKMGKLRKYLTNVQQALDSISKLPAGKLDEQYQQALVDLQEDLNYADYSMNTWMEEFKTDSAEGNEALRIQYLQSEKEKVTKVKENILNALARADSLFKK